MDFLPISTVEKRSLYTAIMVEPREHPAMEFVLLNILENLNVDWTVVLLHGNKNLNYIQRILENHPSMVSRIQLVHLGIDNLTKMEYSDLFFEPRFYEYIPTEMFLVFQTDSMIIPENKDKIYKFMEYDYVGGPWPDTNYIIPLQVGNGGFSLRRKTKMLELLSHQHADYFKHKNIERGDNNYVEDVFFSGVYHENIEIKKPTYEEAKEFSVESVAHESPFGVHSLWRTSNLYEDFINKYPIVKELRDLQI
jgi:hypothetical protein